MKKNTLGMTLLMLLVTVGVLAYFGLQAYRYYADPLTTTLAYPYEVKEGVDLSGYVVRKEQVLPDDTGGLLRLQRSEGERVSVGGTVAVVYADQSSLDRQNEIETVKTRIEQLEYAQKAALGSEVSLKLDAQILQSILRYRGNLSSDRLYEAEKDGGELRSLVLKRDYTYSDNEDLSGQIEAQKERLDALQAQSAASVRRVSAPVSGLYSAVVDGYETVLTPESVQSMTPAAFAAVRPEEGERSQMGKLILGDSWYYAAAMKTAEAEKLAQQKDLTLQFAKSGEREFPVTVASIGPEEQGRSVVVFQSKTYLPQVTLLRQQSAQVVQTTFSGIRVPKEALRAARILQDGEGQRSTEETLGIYCIVGLEARFKPVEVLYTGESFLLVRSAEDAGERTRLRPGDEIIVTAQDLFDGKILNEAAQ